MPIRVLVSAELSLMVIELDGLVTDDEFKRDVLPLVEDPAYNTLRLTLVDSTTATRSDAPGDLIRGTARTVASHVDEKVVDGARIAMAAPSDLFFGLGRMYQALRSDSPVDVGVFRGLDVAEQWLGLEPGYREVMVEPRSLEAD